MGFFDKFKKTKPVGDHFQEAALDMSATAVQYAQSFDKKLDYSPTSIGELEEILEYYSEDMAKSAPTENQVWSMAIIFGSYLGETMLRNGLANKGFRWAVQEPSNVPLLVSLDGTCITPNDKVFKRLVNGKEDSVISFYDVIMSM